jgi:hypothetical protein
VGAKIGLVLFDRTDIGVSALLAKIAELVVGVQAEVADVLYNPRVDLASLATSPPERFEVACAVVRGPGRHPGLGAIADRCSAAFQCRALACSVNDFYQCGGFQLWDRGRSQTGLLLDGSVDIGGARHSYMRATWIGLCHLFGTIQQRAIEGWTNDDGSPVLVDELRAIDLTPDPEVARVITERIGDLAMGDGATDHRIVEDGRILAPPRPLEPDEGLEWDWNSTPMIWPMMEYVARRQLAEKKRQKT